ncbi:chitin deacetylase [Exophiala dermatitidis NIH/UT8656]|uniref:Chitin deacetylase n=1 Tax=Exophiala dermatitidis (strain ATCC 34100 / CBS 525.76 / NIH/UT8656) TaxID=858893 RepID=H6CA87_EXODN|nr:chitin deacetylase [Exophiala dermatitidis NIH/UT8656]EHY60051.1 chitin deacetylase [Exophiala dermatitidis NIH/UT8656]
MAQTIPQTRRVERTGATESVHIPNVAPMLGFASVKKSYGTVPGTGKEYCAVPNTCQSEFGRCDSDATPAGYNTSADDRSLTGDVAYGGIVSNCRLPKVIALTYDDGPSENTEELLDLLKEANAHATFFVSGNNNGKGAIDQTPRWTDAIKRMAEEGHQIASHGWSHADLDRTPSDGRKLEMVKNERALSNILNKYPTYMRPPYLRCNNETGCLRDMRALGYHVVSYSFDSTDWMHGNDLRAMTEAFDGVLQRVEPSEGRMLLIQHDTIRMSAIDLTKHVLERISQRGWRAVTVGECLGDEPDNWYRTPQWTSPSSTAEHGCLVSNAGLYERLDTFKTKEECFKSNIKCRRRVSGCMKSNIDDKTCGALRDICNAQSLFCAQCGRQEKNALACDIGYFNVFNGR